MKVRITESRIPAGIKPSDLGLASETIDISGRQCTMVSHLNKLVRYENGMISDNTYVVFVEGASENADVKYKWTIQVYDQYSGETTTGYSDNFSDNCIFYFNSEIWKEIPNLFFSNKVEVSVEVQISGVDTISIPPIEQEIKNFSYEFEGRKQQPFLGTSSGNLLISDHINNLYLDYIESLKDHEPYLEDCNGDEFRKRRIILALLYASFYKKIKNPKPQVSKEKNIQHLESKWEIFFNRNTEPFQIFDSDIGIANINPLLYAQFVGENVLDINYGPLNPKKREDRPDANVLFSKYLYDNPPDDGTQDFGVKYEKKLIDICNILRFPKSCIRAISVYLEQLKKRKGYTVPWNTLIYDREKLGILLDEFWNGPTDEEITKLKHKNQAQQLINVDFIKQLSNLTTCEKLRTDYYSKIETSQLPDIRIEAKEIWRSIEDCTVIENIFDHYKKLDVVFPDIFHYVLRHQFSFDKKQLEGEEESENEAQKIVVLNVDTHTWIKDKKNSFPSLNEINSMTSDQRKKRYELLKKNGKASQVVVQHFYNGTRVNKTIKESIDLFISLFKELYERATSFEISSGTRFSNKDIIVKSILKKLENLKLENQRTPMLPELDQTQIPEALRFNDVDMVNLERKSNTKILDYSKDIVQLKVPRIFSEFSYEYMKPLGLQFKIDEPFPNYTMTDPSPLENPSDLNNVITKLREWSAKANGKLRLIIRGYADLSFNGTGDHTTYNEALSQRRIEWFLKKFDVTQEVNIVDDVNEHACGDKYSKVPNENPDFREVRMVFEMADNYYQEEENE